MDWLEALKTHSESHPIVVLRFSADEWESLLNARRGANEFTVARTHSMVRDVKVPAPCLVLGDESTDPQAYFGLVSSKSPITTLESRLKVSRAVAIRPATSDGLGAMVTETPHARNLTSRLQSDAAVDTLSPKLSSHLIERLADIQGNRGGMRAVSESLSVPKRFTGNEAVQEDAVQTALAAFGLAATHQASSVELVEGKKTALARVAIMEDSVVEHDARSVPEYALIESEVTGRAVFQRGEEQLEVFTANRRDLEHCFGVDLIYMNLTKQNVVMLQYKMLKAESADEEADWIYRPDSQLDIEIARMDAFASSHIPGPKEYRLNPQVFYLKFVKRDAFLSSGSIIMPLDHFQRVRVDPTFKGPRKGLRLSYRSLEGRYMRQTPFLDLIKCGYIGSCAKTSTDLKTLIAAVVAGDKAVVVAVQKKIES